MPYLDPNKKKEADERFRRSRGISPRQQKKQTQSRLDVLKWLETAEGLDEPMWNPELIPKGYVQSYDQILRRWRVRKEGDNRYLEQFPVIHWGTHPNVLP